MNRMMKNAVCLVLLFALTVFCCAGAAEGTVVASGSCGTNVMWALDDAGTLTISGSGEMINWSNKNYDSRPWVAYSDLIHSIIIKNGVTSIGSYAFYNFANLTTISIPNTVSYISHAFGNCQSLDKVYIPTLKDWMNIEFSGITSNPLYYANKLYVNNELLTHAIIPDDVLLIKPYSFYNCSSLVSVSISDNLTSIGELAFEGCSNLASINLPKSIIDIGESAFSGCSSLSSITLPNSITAINAGTFLNCTNLASINIPNSIVSIGNVAFHGCSNLSSISIPSSVISFGDRIFYNCSSLSSVELPSNLTAILESTFYGCSNLSSILIPDTVSFIGDSAFYNCSKLTSISIPYLVTDIGIQTFYNCTSLASVYIDGIINSIGNEAFENCNALNEVHYRSMKNWLSSSSLSYLLQSVDELYINGKLLTHLDIPKGITTINSHYSHLRSLISVNIPASVTLIDNWGFEGCISLKSVTIPDSITVIGEAAFYNCSGLETLTIPPSAPRISDCAFYNCTGLSTITFQGDLPYIHFNAFHNDSIDQGISSIERVAILGDDVSVSTGPVFPSNTIILCQKNTNVESWASKHNYSIEYLPEYNTPLSISLPSHIDTYVDEKINVAVQSFPSYFIPKLTWYSSRPEVASIDNGVITAHSTGTTLITVTYGDLTSESIVTVHTRNIFTLPASTKSIASEAFLNTPCEYVIIPSSCVSIASRAFANAADIALYMPDSVTDIAGDAFDNCGKVTFICESDNAAATYAEEYGFTYRIEQMQ